jgi:hypothetical protein
MLDAGVDLAVVQKMLGHTSRDHSRLRPSQRAGEAQAGSGIRIPWTSSGRSPDPALRDVDEFGSDITGWLNRRSFPLGRRRSTSWAELR